MFGDTLLEEYKVLETRPMAASSLLQSRCFLRILLEDNVVCKDSLLLLKAPLRCTFNRTPLGPTVLHTLVSM